MKKSTAVQPALFPTTKTGPPSKPGLPEWLRRQIETQDPATFGRFAKWADCRKCGALTLEGWDAYDDYAGHYAADPNRISTAEELDAVSMGRQTFEIRTDQDGRKTLSRRDHHRITASPATAHKWPVIPEHKCNAPLGKKLKPRDLGNR